MEEQIFYPEQFQNAAERTDALLALCSNLAEGNYHVISYDGKPYALKDVADLLAGLCQYCPDDYEPEKLLDWTLQNRMRLERAWKEYMDRHFEDLLEKWREYIRKKEIKGV